MVIVGRLGMSEERLTRNYLARKTNMAPVDTRRITTPEVSQPVIYRPEKDAEDSLVDKDGFRKDGRLVNELRPMFLRAGVVSQAKGSAYLETERTKIICAVYGPREAPRRQEFSMKGRLTCEFKYAPFSCKQRRGHIQNSEEKGNSLLVVQALETAVFLEKFPKSQVDIFITVLENDGSALSAGLICASVALADAGIEMQDLVSACTLAQTKIKSILDPDEQELNSKEVDGHVMVSLLPSVNQISGLKQEGEMTKNSVEKAVNACIDGCVRIYPVMQEALAKNVKRQFLTKETTDR